jgi:intermembrane space import and assembly protein 40
MQNCFRQYPEIYGSEIDKDDAADDDVDDDDFPTAPAASSTSTSTSTASSDPAPVNASSASPQQASSTPHSAEKVAENRRELGLVPENYRPEESKADSTKHEDSLVPKAAHDGRE